MAERSRMLGRLGWFGQCACCAGPRGKREMKRYERRQWERDAFVDAPLDVALAEVDRQMEKWRTTLDWLAER